MVARTRTRPFSCALSFDSVRYQPHRCCMTPDEPFTMPLPPPPPHGPGERDVVFFARQGPAPEAEPGDERPHEDIMLRRVPRDTARRYRAAAGGRGMTHAQYLAALVQLHEAMRARADGGDSEVAAELERLALSSVTI